LAGVVRYARHLVLFVWIFSYYWLRDVGWFFDISRYHCSLGSDACGSRHHGYSSVHAALLSCLTPAFLRFFSFTFHRRRCGAPLCGRCAQAAWLTAPPLHTVIFRAGAAGLEKNFCLPWTRICVSALPYVWTVQPAKLFPFSITFFAFYCKTARCQTPCCASFGRTGCYLFCGLRSGRLEPRTTSCLSVLLFLHRDTLPLHYTASFPLHTSAYPFCMCWLRHSLHAFLPHISTCVRLS